jgi:dTDP-4-dehydrorhamnose 3,5-epimerase
MIFAETRLPGVFEIQIERKCDQRGFFARTWCQQEFAAHGLDSNLVQCSLSYNQKKGTLRGLHYQAEPRAETKLVRCSKGAIYDVVLDLRSGSQTYKRWVGVCLEARKHNALYVPKGCAHGFLTLEDDSEVFYQMSEFYDAESARGVRWNDPAFQIVWPAQAEIISERDMNYPDFEQ